MSAEIVRRIKFMQPCPRVRCIVACDASVVCEDGARSLRLTADVVIELTTDCPPGHSWFPGSSFPASALSKLQQLGVEVLIRRVLPGVGPSLQKVKAAVARSQRIRGARPRQDRMRDSEMNLVIDADIVS